MISKIVIPKLGATGGEVTLVEWLRENAMALQARELTSRQTIPSWLEVDREAFRAKLLSMPKREELTTPEINEQLIVELYSK